MPNWPARRTRGPVDWSELQQILDLLDDVMTPSGSSSTTTTTITAAFDDSVSPDAVTLAAASTGTGTAPSRADHHHPLSQDIAPTWTQNHQWAANVLPSTAYSRDLGSLTAPWRQLYASELVVQSLVTQNVMATVGGRILVAPSTILTRDLASGGTTIYVKHNEMASGDRAYFESQSAVEFVAITSAPSLQAEGDYAYTVTRNLDGSGANAWTAGDSLVNTGTTGDGFIDLYSVSGVNAGTTAGPTIVANVRNSATYSDWSAVWAVGNLKNLYGYGTDTYGAAFGKYANSQSFLTVDTTNGIRMMARSGVGVDTQVAQWDVSGNILIGQTGASQSNVYITAGKVSVRNNTTDKISFAADGTASIDGVLNLGTDGGLFQGTGTFASPTTALKIYNSGGVGLLEMWGSGTKQVYFGSDGILYAGGGNTWLANEGLRIIAGENSNQNISWMRDDNVLYNIYAFVDEVNVIAEARVQLRQAGNGYPGRFQIIAKSQDVDATLHSAVFELYQATGGATGSDAQIKFDTTTYWFLDPTGVRVGINPGTGGIIGIPNNAWIVGRNQANNANVNIWQVNTSNLIAAGAALAAFTLSGNMTVGAGITVDGVDVGSHAHTGGAGDGAQIANITGNAATVTGLSVTAGKTLTVSNTLTLTATDGSTLAIGTGGTLGTAAYTAATAYEASGAIATHAALPDVHHAAITLAASAEVLLGLSTQALSLDNQNANLIFAGPGTAPAAAPTFRAMVAADLGTALVAQLANVGLGVAPGTIRLYATEADYADIATLQRAPASYSAAMYAALRADASTASDAADGYGSCIEFTMTDSGVTRSGLAVIGAVRAGADNTGDISFRPNVAGSFTERAKLTSAGFLAVARSVYIGDIAGADPGINNAYIDGDCSALTFTDRTPMPASLAEAYAAVASVQRRLAVAGLDHLALHPSLQSLSADGQVRGRNLSALVSAQARVIQDLIQRIRHLEAGTVHP